MQPLNTYLGPWKKKPSSNLRKVDFRAGQVTFKAYYPKTSSNKIIIIILLELDTQEVTTGKQDVMSFLGETTLYGHPLIRTPHHFGQLAFSLGKESPFIFS